MGVLNRVLLITACVVGLLCCVAALVEYRDEITNQSKANHVIAAITCLFVEGGLLLGMIIFLICTFFFTLSPIGILCNLIVGKVIAVGGAATVILAAVAYGLTIKTRIEANQLIPSVEEWTFGGIFGGVAVVLIALKIALC